MNQKSSKIVGLMIGIAEWNHKRGDRFLFWGKQNILLVSGVFHSATLLYAGTCWL